MARRGPGIAGRLKRTGVAGVVTAVVLYGLWYWQERDYVDRMSWMGVPQAQQWHEWKTLNRTLRYRGFLVGWSDLRANPLWSTYRLEPVGAVSVGPRPGHFESDWRILWPAGPEAYTGSGFDRGHMAPNYAIAAVHGRDAQLDTFLMSNISPQRPALNRRVWQRLEETAIEEFAGRLGRLWVITGPIFDERITRMASWIEIPDAFYKILVAPGDGGTPVRMLAFIVPQSVSGDEPLARFVVSVDEVEARTGLDFFSDLPDEAERALEARIRTRDWGL